MAVIIARDDVHALAEFCSIAPALESPSLLHVRDTAFRKYGEVAHLIDGQSRATVSINPRVVDESGVPIGCIGNLVLDGPSKDLIAEAHAWLRARSVRIVRGPVVRHTWYPFRAVTSGFERWPVLSGEPTNAVDLPDQLSANGYRVCRRYLTTRTKFLMAEEKSRAKLLRFQEAGFSVRSLNPEQLLHDVGLIHRLINHSFAPPQNTMFAPIDMEEFLAVLGVSPEVQSSLTLDPDWVQLCFAADGTPVGFILMTREGELASIKTLCVAPEYRGDGVGGALVATAHRLAHAASMTWVAHTLMTDVGPSMSITAAGQHEVLRRYAMFECEL